MKHKTFIRTLGTAARLGVLLWLAAGPIFAQVAIRGKITDENNTGLPGVSVVVKNTTRGTTTDANGTYTVDVPDRNASLIFSFTGYQSQEVRVGNQASVDLQMAVDTKTLDEMVVIGYGTQRKVDLTGSVASVTNKEFENRPYTNPDQILSGRVTGVLITNRSGDPGAPIDVRIRGVGTVGNNQPLWVIDGVPIVQTTNITVNTNSTTESNPLAGINPSDIESMDILKDASATAIYGARAANGVVIVTTKRGKAGRTTASYDGYYGVQKVSQGRRLDVLGVADYIALQKELGRDYSAFANQPAVDWQDLIFQTGAVRNHNLSVRGGTENINFNIGGGYHGQDGVERGQNFERFSIRANVDAKAGKYFRFGNSLLISSTKRQTQSEGANFAAFSSLQNAPYFKPYDASQPSGYNLEINENRGAGAAGANYLWRTDPKYNDTQVLNRKMIGNLYGEFEPVKGLKFRTSYGLDFNVADGYLFQENVDYGASPRSSLLVQERPIELTTNLTNTLTFQRTFGQHDLAVLVGHEETNFRFDKVRLQGRNLFNSNIRFASVATTVAGANEADQWALRGYLGRINYSFRDRYLLAINVRRDETSRFSKENRAGVFPSASVGWRLSEESFVKDNLPAINELKIRASWGTSGNQFTGQNFAYLPSLATTIFYVTGTSQSVVRGPSPIVFANPNLKWETSVQTDFGFDLGLLNNRLTATFDYFNKETNDVLLSLPIPYTSGYFLPADANVGKIRNSGVEFSTTYQDRIGELGYSIGGNITFIKNRVVSLGEIPEIITGVGGNQSHRTTVGQPLGYFYGFKTDGIYRTADEAAKALPDAFSAGAQAGDIRYVDINNDGKIDAGDRTYLGSSIPGYYYGINLGLSYKGFDLSALFQGVGNVKLYNAARQGLEGMNGGNNQLTTVLDRYSATNTGGSLPRATLSDPNNNNRYSDRWIERGDYIRLKNIQIGYNIPARLISKIPGEVLSSGRLFIGVQNLFTATRYKGYDPEVTRGSSFQKGEFPLANGQDSGGSPQPRIVQFGWSLTF